MRILISPLDWGLGHATRCIPVIRALHNAGHVVVGVASGSGLRLLQVEFPDVEFEELPSYTMRYSKSRFLLPFRIVAQLPMFFASILRERTLTRRLVLRHEIDRVISDGRYGVRTRRVPCVFITHQLSILPPGPEWLRTLLRRPILAVNRLALKGFNEIWVPDFPGTVNLSGQLGHPHPVWTGVRYIFPLCRFRPDALPWNRPAGIKSLELKIDVLALVSGPEPQRTVFEEMLTAALENMPGTRVLVRGLPGRPAGADNLLPLPVVRQNELNVFDHLSGNDLTQFLTAADHVACRSGYTSVMELAGLGKRNVLMIPTPGQPEQEYLTGHLEAMGFSATQTQEGFDLEAGLRHAHDFPGFMELFRMDEAWNLEDWIREHPLFHVPKRLPGKFVL